MAVSAYTAILEMGKNPNPARTDRTRNQVLSGTEPENKNVQELEPNGTP